MTSYLPRAFSYLTICLLLASLGHSDLIAQAGQVSSYQTITTGSGGFTGTLQASELFGFSVAGIGDLDGDGRPDMITGSPQHDGPVHSDDGAAWVLFMNPNGTVKSHQLIGAGTGGFTDPLEIAAIFGTGVAPLGEFDGDVHPDVVVGAARVTDGDGHDDAGAIFILFLNPNGTVKSHQKITDGFGGLTGELAVNSWFGYGVTNMGDLDSDGTTDLAVGAPNLDGGYVYILFLNPNGTVKATQKIGTGVGGFTGTLGIGDWWGVDVANIGDLNGGGVNDLLVGSRGEETVWILFMNTNGTVDYSQEIGIGGLGGFTGTLDAGDNFGRGVSAARDIDGDGVREILVGARRDDDGGTNRGAVWLLFMNSTGTVKYHQKISDTSGGFAATIDDSYEFGSAVGLVGDFNADAKPEYAVAGRGNDGDGAIQILFVNSDVTLPVELVSFDVVLDGDMVRTTWTTASEENNAGFEVDAFDATTELWETVTYVEGAGTITTLTSYGFDIHDVEQRYTKFRLKQIDYDGAVSFLPEVEIVRDLSAPYLLSNAYPNPFNTTSGFTLSLATKQHVNISLYDVMGRVVSTVHNGELSANTLHRFQIDASELSTGNYFYRVAGERFQKTKRVALAK